MTYTRVKRPDRPLTEELDTYLADGWYRIGPTLMTCRCLVFSGVLRSSLWTRLPLQGFQFRKSLRRLMARNQRRFRITHGPMVIDAAHEGLYRRYCGRVRGERSATLHDFLYGDQPPHDVFDTREIAIWDGDTLVGFSWFDEGRESLQSLIGVYEPALAQHSLGFYSMLLEIAHGMATGKRFHYSGYVLPGDASMDYKLRVGEVEFLDQDVQVWRPWSEVADYALPTDRLMTALERVRTDLAHYGIDAIVRPYPWFDAGVYNEALARCIDQPLILETRPLLAHPLIVTWDLDLEEYVLLRCVRAVAIVPGDTEDDIRRRRPDLLVVTERLAVRARAAAIATELARLSGSVQMAR